MNKALFLMILFLLSLSVVVAQSDLDGDGIKDDFDNCNQTAPNSQMPVIKTHLNFLGCSCKQIDAALNPKLECYSLFCQQDRPLEITELSECVNKTSINPDAPKDDDEQSEEAFGVLEVYDLLVNNPELKKVVGNPDRAEFSDLNNTGYVYDFQYRLISKQVGGVNTQFSRIIVNVVPENNYLLKNVVVFVNVPERFDMVDVIYKEEPDYVVGNVAIWHSQDVDKKEVVVDIKSNDLVEIQNHVYAQTSNHFNFWTYLPYILVALFLVAGYIGMRESIKKHKN